MENQRMNRKRSLIRLISYLVSLFLVLTIWGATETYTRRQYEQQIRISQERALSELGNYMSNITVALQKGVYANTEPMLAGLSSSLWRESTGAKESLAQLGDGENPLFNTYKFLSQVGNFTMALNRKLADGKNISTEERKELKTLLSFARSISEHVDYMQLMFENQQFTFEESLSSLSLDKNQGASSLSYIEGIGNAEETLVDFPTLIYDGPFSDNINQKESKLLKQANPISRDKARQIALEYCNAKPDEIFDAGEEDGRMPAYLFSYGNGSMISVTKAGGYVPYMICGSFAKEEKFDQRQSIEKASEFLKEHGYENMTENYFSTNDGICTINFAYMQDEITCYPDLVKVSVSMDTGKVIAIDARSYIMNHYERETNPEGLSYQQAMESVSEELQVEDISRAIIPTDSGKEIFAYEFLCKGNEDEDILVYINAATGDEADILMLLYSDGGILTR